MMKATRTTALLFLLLLTAAWAGGAQPEKGDHGIVFTYTAPAAEAVYLAADFNGWNDTALPMDKGASGVWSLSVDLEPGTYEYKFVVDGAWMDDPDNPDKVDDPFGGANSRLTVLAGGEVALAGAPAATASTPAPAAGDDQYKPGPPRAEDGGVLFTHEADNAGSVFLAGTFNGWSATDTPLTRGENGIWWILKPLDAGEHEYKFVVDGNWFQDPENPDTKVDPFGGSNSVINLDGDGNLVAATPAGVGGATRSTTLNAKLNLNGRYLTRMETSQGVLDDPRYRMQRPQQTVDLNFDAQINEVAETYMRIRMDSESNLIQNNVAGVLDEGGLTLHPDVFNLNAYLNQEIYSSRDIIATIGDIDHPATIGYDHLDFGKGTAGALIETWTWGVNTRAFFANVHNNDFYNDPELFDNVGRDVIGVRFSRQEGAFELAVPLFLQRDLLWLDFNDIVGQASTGIPVLDEHIAATDDGSTSYETDRLLFRAGLEANYRIAEEWRLGAQWMRGNDKQRFVTGNDSGENLDNGNLDLPFFDRNSNWLGLQARYERDRDHRARIRHIRSDFSGAGTDERVIAYSYRPQTEADKKIFFTIQDSPAETDETYTELEGAWQLVDTDLGFWIWHQGLSRDYGATGANVPGDSTRTSNDPSTWYISGKVAYGQTDSRFGRAELEFGFTFHDPDVGEATSESQEFILRGERDLTRKTAAILDIRQINYQLAEGGKPSYWAPFIGIKHQPIRDLELVLGYGVDPVDFSIDYAGRQFGRWWYRQNYLFDNEDATAQDAERALADARVFTLRAQFIF